MRKLNKKQLSLTFIILIVVITISVVLIVLKSNKTTEEKLRDEKWENPFTQINKNEIQYQENASVDELKKETGLTADSNLYEVNTEYDGRKVLNIKASIQYKVAFAGLIKQQIPGLKETDKIFQENHPDKNGIWIEKKSRVSILEIIKGNTKSEYEIDSEGYLKIKNKKQQNDKDKIIEEWINSDKKIILAKDNLYYQVDEVTGEVTEYPFEQLDPYQTYDQIKSDNNIIIILTSNDKKYLNNNEILQDVLQCEL